MVVYLPVLQHPFSTFSLSAADWCIVALAALTISPVLEFVKWLERRGWFGASSDH
jgi:hypothetical protein